MSDNIQNTFPQRGADSNEGGVHLIFSEGELATFSKYLNRSSLGATYDAVTKVGLPIIGQGSGIYVTDDANSYYQGTAYSSGVALAGEHEVSVVPSVMRIVVQNGAQHLARVSNAGQFEISLNSGATYSTAAWNFANRGPFHWIASHDGTNQVLWINGRLIDSDAVALGVPSVNYQVGRTGTARRVRFLQTQPQARLLYLKDFAKNVVSFWKPSFVGEGPAGGIPTGAVGEGDFYCPSGASTLLFSWLQREQQLALADSGALSLSRLDFAHPHMPSFGSFLFTYKVTDVTNENPYFALIDSTRGTDFTGASGRSYWVQSVSSGGQWRTTFHRDNGAALLTVNHSLPVNGDVCRVLITRHPSGDWRLYSSKNGIWYGTPSTVSNDITYLSSGFISIAPRKSSILSFTRFQGELEPQET